MKKKRPIIEIDEDLCNGCGQCIISCAEDALQLVDGKARLAGEVYCDGLGACIGECPTGALTIVEREAEDFDQEAVEERLAAKAKEQSPEPEPPGPDQPEPLPCGCPGSMTRVIERRPETTQGPEAAAVSSELYQWPIKLQLLNPQAPFLKGADLMLMADCTAVAFPELHRKLIKDKALAIGCPKLDDLDAHIERLAKILEAARPRSLTVAHMEVPCCHGFVYAAQKAVEKSGVALTIKTIKISISGEILEEKNVSTQKPIKAVGT